jgi:hypothetical protein
LLYYIFTHLNPTIFKKKLFHEANLGISMISMISVWTIIDYGNVTLFEQIVLNVNYYGNCDTRQKHLV